MSCACGGLGVIWTAHLAGCGPTSDGVPELLDGGDTLPGKPTRPPRRSDPLAAFDKTAEYRRIA